MHIVLFATEWSTGKGGINAFNMSFAIALAKVGGSGVRVTCAVQRPSTAEVRLAAAAGVRLVSVDAIGRGQGREAARDVLETLVQGDVHRDVDFWVGHDVSTGFAAVEAAEAFGGTAAVIHHMNYESYKNLPGGKGVSTMEKHLRQVELLSSPGVALFGVGPDLAESARRLGAADAWTIVPGFPEAFRRNSAGSAAVYAMVAGRFDRTSEPLKQSRLVAAGLGRAVAIAGGGTPALRRATLAVFGTSRATAIRAELEGLAFREAKRAVTVNPTTFTTASNDLIAQLARSNLAFMPSVREGFGLTGWEAIGCEVPLILGDQTGLYSFLDATLEGRADRYVHPIALTGLALDERDIVAVAERIVAVAGDIEHYRSIARELKAVLKDRLRGCTWNAAAERFIGDLRSVAAAARQPSAARHGHSLALPAGARLNAGWDTVNHRQRTAHLKLPREMNQGDTSRCFDVLPTLHFGATEIAIERQGVEVEVELRRALLHVTSEHGWTGEERLGDERHPSPGVKAKAGDVWELTDPAGGMLGTKILDGRTLCRVETPENLPAHARIEVTAAKRDIAYRFVAGRELEPTTRKVMKIFLDGALFKEESGHLVLSTSVLREVP